MTGLTAGHGGASQRLGVKPDLVTLAKSIGGGLPLAAFGGKREVMEVVVDGRMAHFGTYNGNALCMAAAEAVDELCTHEALAAAEQVNLGALEAIDTVIDEYELPAHTVGVGLKGCVTWSTSPVRNYRDYKATDFGVAELSGSGASTGHPHPARPRRAVAGLARPHHHRHGPTRGRRPRVGQGATRLTRADPTRPRLRRHRLLGLGCPTGSADRRGRGVGGTDDRGARARAGASRRGGANGRGCARTRAGGARRSRPRGVCRGARSVGPLTGRCARHPATWGPSGRRRRPVSARGAGRVRRALLGDLAPLLLSPVR